MKKILFYNGSLRIGGIEKVLVEVLQNMDLKKYKVDLLIEDGHRKLNVLETEIPQEIPITYLRSEKSIDKTIKYRKNKHKNIFSKIMFNVMMMNEKIESKKNLVKFLEGKSYDVVIDFDMGLSKEISLVKASKKIAWVHSSIEKWYEKPKRIARLGERLKKYDLLVTICDDMKIATSNLYPFLKEKIVRIYNPFNLKKIKVLAENKSAIEGEMEKFHKMPYIVSVMRLTEHSKDFKTLVLGFKEAKERGIEEKLYILGDGPDRILVEELIRKNGLENEIILLGSQKNPYPWIKDAKLFVHSSKYEGLPTVLIEAIILNKMVISSDCPTGPKEITADGKYGALFQVGDSQELGRLIYKYLKNPEEKNKVIEKLGERAEDFSSEMVMKEYEKVIGE